MRHLIVSIALVTGACSATDQPAVGALNADGNVVAACVTEELLREANASEDDIRKFKEDEARLAAESEAGCG